MQVQRFCLQARTRYDCTLAPLGLGVGCKTPNNIQSVTCDSCVVVLLVLLLPSRTPNIELPVRLQFIRLVAIFALTEERSLDYDWRR